MIWWGLVDGFYLYLVLGDIPEKYCKTNNNKKNPDKSITFLLEYSIIIWNTNLCQMPFDVLYKLSFHTLCSHLHIISHCLSIPHKYILRSKGDSLVKVVNKCCRKATSWSTKSLSFSIAQHWLNSSSPLCDRRYRMQVIIFIVVVCMFKMNNKMCKHLISETVPN